MAFSVAIQLVSTQMSLHQESVTFSRGDKCVQSSEESWKRGEVDLFIYSRERGGFQGVYPRISTILATSAIAHILHVNKGERRGTLWRLKLKTPFICPEGKCVKSVSKYLNPGKSFTKPKFTVKLPFCVDERLKRTERVKFF